MRLNDFLTREPDGRGVVDTNRDVMPEEFFRDPNKYIRNKGALKEIQATGSYARMERNVRDEMDLEEVVRKLYKNGVDNLLGWSEAAANVKTSVHNSTKQSLDSAAEEARNLTTTIEAMKMEGCTSLCTMRGGAMWWKFPTAWSERKRGREWRWRRGNRNSHGRTRKLATPSKRMTLCGNPVHHLPG
ncbi:putative retrotransposon hot spot protein (RHS) [Trypanosoma cruzi]|uniref:Putative retrotransposon hot spot protein (RHS) n=1 Tax=Trypanosoma cruzi TaxID=5693 RepID=A0A2V2WFM0_TRYCR|nr:putative retrotransposon hot spot protein (RHS) [Trypanosoma cruzi]RNC38281.1 retrotransposon hot spot (RHS) protein [Trypanosoma cruzi]